MEIKRVVDPSEYQIGCVIGRLQVNNLHPSQVELLDDVCKNHKKVILLLGVPNVLKPDTDPLDFATRKAMVQNDYPNIVILPIKDNRSNQIWSKNVDEQIANSFGDKSALLYGSRDSFIPYYSGKHKTVELITDTYYSGTEVRKNVRREILGSSDFRSGVIYGKADRYPTAYSTVDIACIKGNIQLLLGKKKDEPKLRFIGGFVDPSDDSKEISAMREFKEETGGCEIDELKYVCSCKINDWRYKNSKDSIITTLFVGKFIFGSPTPNDDIDELSWVSLDKLKTEEEIDLIIMPEHKQLLVKLIKHLEEHGK